MPACVLVHVTGAEAIGVLTLSLHDALPISCGEAREGSGTAQGGGRGKASPDGTVPCRIIGRRDAFSSACAPDYLSGDRKSTRLNSSHVEISYAVFCLKKKTIHCRSAVSDACMCPCSCYGRRGHRRLDSFPTRRSSDLVRRGARRKWDCARWWAR